MKASHSDEFAAKAPERCPFEVGDRVEVVIEGIGQKMFGAVTWRPHWEGVFEVKVKLDTLEQASFPSLNLRLVESLF